MSDELQRLVFEKAQLELKFDLFFDLITAYDPELARFIARRLSGMQTESEAAQDVVDDLANRAQSVL
jgi:hypothetical protein